MKYIPFNKLLFISVLLLLLGCTWIAAFGQTTTSLRVMLTDANGGVVAGAQIKIENQTTHETRTATTNADGIAVFSGLTPGLYTVSAEATGFAITQATNVEVRVSQANGVPLTMGIGESSLPEVGAIADPLNDLPNLNNDSSSFLRSVPGAVAGSAASLGKIVVDGKGKEQQTLRLDGLDITPLTDLPTGDPLLGVLDTLLKPNVALDTTQTDTLAGALAFKPSGFTKDPVNQPTYDLSPLYGPGTGSLILGKSVPGDMEKWKFTFYDSFRHDALNAANVFDYEGKNGLRRNLFGVKFGTPFKKKLSTFFAYDGIRARVERPVYEAVPVDALCDCGQGPFARLIGLFLPRGTTLMQGTSLNPDFVTARRLLRSTSDSDSFDSRFDVASASLSPTITMNNFFVRFTDQSARFLVPDGVTGRQQKQTLNLASGVAGISLLTTNTRHQIRFGINQNRSGIDIVAPYSTFPELSQSLITVSSSNPIPVKNLPGQVNGISYTIPTASLGGLSKGVGRGFKQKPVSFNLSYDLSATIRSRYDLDAGFEARFVNFNVDKFGGLTYAFGDVPKLRANLPGTINFLSDLSEAAPFGSGSGPRHVKQQNYLSYVQLTTKFSNFRVRWGLRYDYFGAVTERDNRAVIVDPATGIILSPTESFSFVQIDKLNFQPRISVVYSKSSFALRAGAGIYSGTPRIGDLVLPVESDRFNTGTTSGIFPFASSQMVSSFINDADNRQFQPLSFARDFKIPEKIYRWDAMLTKTLHDAWDLNVLYSGNVGRRLPVAGVSNQIISVQTNENPTKPAVVVRQFDIIRNGEVFKPRGELLFRASTGHSSYNGLTIQFRRNRLDLTSSDDWFSWRNFRSLNAQYTLSRNVGNASGAVVSAPNDFDSDFGFNAADARHTFSFSTSYRFWKKDVHPQNGPRGWSISTVVTARSGLPLIIRQERPDVVYLDSNGNVFAEPALGRAAVINTPGGGASGGARVPNLVPGANPFTHAGFIFLNPAAFSIPKPGEFGNLKRGQLRGPGAFQADLRIIRTLFQTTTEGKAFLSELNIEIFNLFNRRNFANPPVTLPNMLGTSATGDRIQPGVPFTRLAAGTFGVINSAEPGRTLQLTLSLRFNDGY